MRQQLTRAAEAHLMLHDLDAALERARLVPHAAPPAIREFLDATSDPLVTLSRRLLAGQLQQFP